MMMKACTLNSDQVFTLMQSGATLRTNWKLRGSTTKPRKLAVLTTPMGISLSIQHSAVSSLVRHKRLRCIGLQGGNVAYYLPEEFYRWRMDSE